MAMRCQYCNKGRMYGHAVSHAKNRVNRSFLPNLQRFRLVKNKRWISVTLCTKCIKRLKKDGRLGSYYVKKEEEKKQKALHVPQEKKEKKTTQTKSIEKEKPKEKPPAEEKKKKEEKKKTGKTPTLNIEDIVGKKE